MSKPLMHIIEATREFEHWLGRQLPIVLQNIQTKHASMAEFPFSFFRATFYRWVQLWPAVCKDLALAPRLLAVGR